MPVHNAEIATMFDHTADLLEIQGSNPFRVRAYRRAARVVETLPQSVTSLMAAGEDLATYSGIGKDLAGKIGEIATTGRFELLDSLRRDLPDELGAMAALPGLGPKRVNLLYDEMGICTLADLRDAAAAGRLHTLRGFGVKVEQKILAVVAQPIVTEQRFKRSAVESEAEALVAFLREGLDTQVTVAGSYRRRRDTVADLDILIAGRDGASGERLAAYENVTQVVARGPTRSTVILRSGLQVDLRIVPKQSYGAALVYFTGSKSTWSG